MNSVAVRKIDSREISQVEELFEAFFMDTFHTHAPVFQEATDGEQIYAALLEGSLAGFASVWEPDRFIHFLFVSPAFRHKKIGSALVKKLAEIYGLPLTLKCLLKNEDAMAFYRATGWEKIGDGISEDGAYALLRYTIITPP